MQPAVAGGESKKRQEVRAEAQAVRMVEILFKAEKSANRPGAGAVLEARGPSAKLPGFFIEQEPALKGFFARLKEFLTERPVKLPAGKEDMSVTGPTFGAGFAENLKDYFRSAPASARNAHSRMMVEWKPWHQAFWENIRDAIAPRNLPPLKVTSKPIKVRDIWSKNEQAPKTQLASLLVHVLAIILLTIPILHQMQTQAEAKKPTQVVTIELSPYLAKLPPGGKKAGGGGGGGERNPTPASKGVAPRFAMTTPLVPPKVKPLTAESKLMIEPTLLGPPEIKIASPPAQNWGDPLAKLFTDSSGPGSSGGIGSGAGGGIGSGTGPGLGPGEGGGVGGGVFQAGRGGVGIPECVYCPSPTFSQEAVKAKYQGPVTIRLIVTADGRPKNIIVVQGPGLGLEEKAIETVTTWRFKPATGANGKPVDVWVTVEVTYRLM